MRQTRLSYSTETGTDPSCSRILGFAGGGAQLDTSRSIAQPHRVLDLHNGPLSVENWRCLETQAYYCMTSKNVLMLIKFLSMTTLFAILNHIAQHVLPLLCLAKPKEACSKYRVTNRAFWSCLQEAPELGPAAGTGAFTPRGVRYARIMLP